MFFSFLLYVYSILKSLKITKRHPRNQGRVPDTPRRCSASLGLHILMGGHPGDVRYFVQPHDLIRFPHRYRGLGTPVRLKSETGNTQKDDRTECQDPLSYGNYRLAAATQGTAVR